MLLGNWLSACEITVALGILPKVRERDFIAFGVGICVSFPKHICHFTFLLKLSINTLYSAISINKIFRLRFLIEL